MTSMHASPQGSEEAPEYFKQDSHRLVSWRSSLAVECKGREGEEVEHEQRAQGSGRRRRLEIVYSLLHRKY